MGDRLANAWRGETFPRSRPSLDPAAYVYSRAPKLMDVFTRGATIYPTDGRRYLAIPTDNVPNRRGARGAVAAMTPLDVEVLFNQDLIIRRGRNGHLLAFVSAVPGSRGRGFKPATRGRLAKGREVRLVLMFTLVRQSVIRRRFRRPGHRRRLGRSRLGHAAAEDRLMASKRLLVLKAVIAAIEAALPNAEVKGLSADDAKPSRIGPGGTVIVRAGDPGEPEVDLSPLAYNYTHRIPVEVGAYEAGGLGPEDVVDAMLGAIGEWLITDPTLGGLVDHVEPSAASTDDFEAFGAEAGRWGDAEIVATYSTPSPLN